MSILPHKAVKFKESAIRKAIDACSVEVQEKLDGVRGEILIEPTADIDGQVAAQVNIFSRTDKLIPALVGLFKDEANSVYWGKLLEESIYPEGLILDGEFMVKHKTFEESSGMLRRKKQLHVSELEFHLYGVLPASMRNHKDPIEVGHAVMHEQCKSMLIRLKDDMPCLDWKIPANTTVYNFEDIAPLYEQARKDLKEGLVIKDSIGFYQRGKKTGMWKMKPEDTVDGVVIDVNWGTAGLGNEGKVIGFEVELEDGTVCAANGLTEAQMTEYTEMVLSLLEAVPTQELDDIKAGLVCLEPEENPFWHWQVQVKFMERTSKGGLRHPNFDCWRGLEDSPTVKS